MKLRIKGNSIRIRLTRGEVDQLAHAGVVEQRTEFPLGGALISRVRRADCRAIAASLDGATIDIVVPSILISEWASTDLVTLESEPSASMQLLIEKDFECLHKRSDDDVDAYPHPARLRE